MRGLKNKMKFKITRTSRCEEEPTDKLKLTKETYKNRFGYYDFIWVGEINTLEELIEFMKKENGIIISETCGYYKGIEYEIEIYDDYRE